MPTVLRDDNSTRLRRLPLRLSQCKSVLLNAVQVFRGLLNPRDSTDLLREDQLTRLQEIDTKKGNLTATALRNRLQQATPFANDKNETANICLDDRHVMRLPLKLPASASRSLCDTIRYQLLTESPIDPELVYFGYRVHQRESRWWMKRPASISVTVALARRSYVDDIVQKIEDANISAIKVGAADQGSNRLDYVFATSKGAKQSEASQRANRLLLSSALLIGFAGLLAINGGAWYLTEQTRDQVAQHRQNQAATLSTVEAYNRILAVRDAYVQQTHHPRLTQVLDALSRALPRDAWLQTIQYDQGALRLQGFSPNPSTITDALSVSDLMHSLHLEAVQRAPGTGSTTTQFVISGTAGPEARP